MLTRLTVGTIASAQWAAVRIRWAEISEAVQSSRRTIAGLLAGVTRIPPITASAGTESPSPAAAARAVIAALVRTGLLANRPAFVSGRRARAFNPIRTYVVIPVN
jgi:alkylhydroperoxidase family enzyme